MNLVTYSDISTFVETKFDIAVTDSVITLSQYCINRSVRNFSNGGVATFINR